MSTKLLDAPSMYGTSIVNDIFHSDPKILIDSTIILWYPASEDHNL